MPWDQEGFLFSKPELTEYLPGPTSSGIKVTACFKKSGIYLFPLTSDFGLFLEIFTGFLSRAAEEASTLYEPGPMDVIGLDTCALSTFERKKTDSFYFLSFGKADLILPSS